MGKHDKDYDTTVARAAGNILAGAGISANDLRQIGMAGDVKSVIFVEQAIIGAAIVAKKLTDVVRQIAPMKP